MMKSTQIGRMAAISACLLVLVGLSVTMRGRSNETRIIPECVNANAMTKTCTIQIMVAAQDLPAGSEITPESVTQKVLKLDSASRYMIKHAPFIAHHDRDIYLGTLLGNRITAGDPIMPSDLFDPSPKLADHIPEGLLAYTIEKDDIQGLNSKMEQGDRVNLIWETHDTSTIVDNQANMLIESLQASVTFLQNVRVLDAKASKDANGAPYLHSITLGLTPHELNTLIVLRTMGTFHIALRHPDDVTTIPITLSTPREDLKNLATLQDQRNRKVKKRWTRRKNPPSPLKGSNF